MSPVLQKQASEGMSLPDFLHAPVKHLSQLIDHLTCIQETCHHHSNQDVLEDVIQGRQGWNLIFIHRMVLVLVIAHSEILYDFCRENRKWQT